MGRGQAQVAGVAGAPDLPPPYPEDTPSPTGQKGYLADRLGFPALFHLAAGLYALALLLGRRLPEEG